MPLTSCLCYQYIVSRWTTLQYSCTHTTSPATVHFYPFRYNRQTKPWFSRRWVCCQFPLEPTKPRFRIKEEDNSREQREQDEIESINDQLRREILETKKRLGIREIPLQTKLSDTEDSGDVSLWNTFIASVVASLLAVLLDLFAWKVYNYIGTHPASETDMYIVQRLSVVIRLVLIGFSTLAGGIVSTVALGLILLLLQTSFKRLMEQLRP